MTDHWLRPWAVSPRSNLPWLPALPVSYTRACSPLRAGRAVSGLPWQLPWLQGTADGGAGSQRGLQQLGCADSSPPELPAQGELQGTRTRELGAPWQGRWMGSDLNLKNGHFGSGRAAEGRLSSMLAQKWPV